MPKSSKEGVLPRPDRIHHIVEDFLTLWYAANADICFEEKFKGVIVAAVAAVAADIVIARARD